MLHEQKFKDLQVAHAKLVHKESDGLGTRGYERPGFYSNWG